MSSQNTQEKPQNSALSALPEEKEQAVAPPTRSEGMSYTLDRSDTIVAVSGNWDNFALDNNGEKTLSDQVVGRKLDQFITGDDTRMFVRTMIMSARTLRRPIYRPYRCDSPKLKRFMEMTVLPRDGGAVEVIHRELHSEPVFHNIPIIAAPVGTCRAYLKRCSLCNRVQAQGVWSEIDEAINTQRLETSASSLKVIYGVCPDCLTRRGVPL
jgi:hypothetical protein